MTNRIGEIEARVTAGAKALAVAGNVVLRNDDGHEGDHLDAETQRLIACAPGDLRFLLDALSRLTVVKDEAVASAKYWEHMYRTDGHG